MEIHRAPSDGVVEAGVAVVRFEDSLWGRLCPRKAKPLARMGRRFQKARGL